MVWHKSAGCVILIPVCRNRQTCFPQNGKPLTVEPEQALVVTQILEAVYESAKTGKTVYFD